ncbi:outer membrane beta-barrel protein [candidate division CSSED10-310 bacterium]|uniref:Outer membrane beta-barrel protein n=1 Tax=candidate division CSSED10-310 bacterium TaxID=2855610 RepID=A0ABV6YT10_UNCC1
MKKLLTFLIITVLIIPVSAAAWSNDRNTWGVGLHGSYWAPEDVDEETIFFGLHGRHRLFSRFAAEGSIDFYTEEIEKGVDLILYPIQVSGIFYFISTDHFELNGLFGVGWYFWEIDSEYINEKDHDFGGHLGAGIELPLTNYLSIQGDVRWVYLKPDVENDDFEVDEIDLTGVWATLGITFYL